MGLRFLLNPMKIDGITHQPDQEVTGNMVRPASTARRFPGCLFRRREWLVDGDEELEYERAPR